MSEQTHSPAQQTFKAEIRQLLDILAHSLYTDREIFLRELVSNASDALNRLRFEMLTNPDVITPDAELGVWITADKDNRTLTIRDTGIGMTQAELARNLGTIAQSGAREFIKATQKEQKDFSDIIGQFGVGFYSAFMVAESITVTSRSYHPDGEGGRWFSQGGETFSVEPFEVTERGTTIVLQLREDAAEFTDEYRLREIIRRHSDYVAFPIYIGDKKEQANSQTAIWRRSPSSVEADEYRDFYRQLTLEFTPPLKHMHLTVDAPLQVYALLFFPSGERGFFSLRKEEGLKLYARKVLIQEYSKDLLPQHFRFIQGVVDAEDLPLNVSRESIQSNAIMARLKKILTGRVMNTLKDMARDAQNPETYVKFWEKFGAYLKEGVTTTQDTAEREGLLPLLRFRTNRFPDQWNSLDQYIERAGAENKTIYYLLGEDQKSILHSPHLDYFAREGHEVLLLTEPIDSFMVGALGTYQEHTFENAATTGAAQTEKPEPAANEAEEKPVEEPADPLMARIQHYLGERVAGVRKTERLSTSVARLVDPEGARSQEMHRVQRILEKDYQIPKLILEINPNHPIIQGLARLPEESPLVGVLVEQIYTNTLLIEGLLPDPAAMLPNIQALMQAAVKEAGQPE